MTRRLDPSQLLQPALTMLRSSLPSLRHPNVLASAASIVLFVAVLAWWAWIFHAPALAASGHVPQQAPLDTSAGGTLFGAQPERGSHDQVQLLGILAFDPRHAAAIVSVGSDPARVVHVSGSIADSTTLSEVRAHSIVIERNGIRHEISLPEAQDPSAFVR
jgi:general secretion pathway protein C